MVVAVSHVNTHLIMVVVVAEGAGAAGSDGETHGA